jgi:hypothetical protein
MKAICCGDEIEAQELQKSQAELRTTDLPIVIDMPKKNLRHVETKFSSGPCSLNSPYPEVRQHLSVLREPHM